MTAQAQATTQATAGKSNPMIGIIPVNIRDSLLKAGFSYQRNVNHVDVYERSECDGNIIRIVHINENFVDMQIEVHAALPKPLSNGTNGDTPTATSWDLKAAVDRIVELEELLKSERSITADLQKRLDAGFKKDAATMGKELDKALAEQQAAIAKDEADKKAEADALFKELNIPQ